MPVGKKLLHHNWWRKVGILLSISAHIVFCLFYWHWMWNQYTIFLDNAWAKTMTFWQACMAVGYHSKWLPFFPIPILLACLSGGKWKAGLFAVLGEVIIITAYFFLYVYFFWAIDGWFVISLGASMFVLILTVFFFFVLFKRKILQIKKASISVPFISLTD